MATFVLVHGAFHGAWCFVKLVPALAARGHRAVAIDLPSFGEDLTPVAGVSLAGNAERIVDIIESEAEPVVLLGHSLAGISISAAAERAPDKIRCLVYLAAFLPRDGDSVASISKWPTAKRDSGPAAFAKTPDGLAFFPIAEPARDRFFSGCSDEDIAYAIPRLKPQAYTVQREPVRLTPERFGRVARVYVECLGDNAISLGLQRDMVAKSPCRVVVSLPTGHSPFFSAPERLAAELDGALDGLA